MKYIFIVVLALLAIYWIYRVITLGWQNDDMIWACISLCFLRIEIIQLKTYKLEESR